MLKHIKCNLCGSRDYKILYKKMALSGRDGKETDYFATTQFAKFDQVVKCKECGLIYANPRESEQELIAQYRAMVDKEYINEAVGRKATFGKIIEEVEKFKRDRKLLDIGCSIGFLLEVAKGRGWEVYGVELSAWAANYAREKLQIPVIKGTLEEAKFSSRFFDVVVLADIIEHLPDPLTTLREVNRILKEKGIIVLTTPNIESLLAKILKRRWYCLRKAHLYYFSPKTLRAMLSKAGFKVIKVRTHTKRFSGHYLISRFKNYNRFIYNILNFLIEKTNLSQKLFKINLRDQMEVYAQRAYLCKNPVP